MFFKSSLVLIEFVAFAASVGILAGLIGNKPKSLAIVFVPEETENVTRTPKNLHNREPDFQNVSAALTSFNSKLYKELLKSISPEENHVYSPYVVDSLLGMIYAGAGGDSAAEMRKVLKLQGFSKENVLKEFQANLASLNTEKSIELLTSSKAFVQQGFAISDEYVKKIQEVFNGNVETLNFQNAFNSASRINSWAEEKTNGNIKNLINQDAISCDTKLILANAIYFNGAWKEEFNQYGATKNDRFYYDPSVGRYTMMPFMNRETTMTQYGKIDELSAEAIVLPYTGNRFVMVAILSDETLGIADLERRISQGYDLTKIPQSLSSAPVNLKFPKFKIESEISFVSDQIFKRLGLTKILNEDANFQGISTSEGLYLSEVIQKAVFDVTETGTVAAAAGAAIMAVEASATFYTKSITVTFNRPFLGYIMDLETKAILFTYRKVN